MKRILAFLCVFVMVAALFGCQKNEASDGGDKSVDLTEKEEQSSVAPDFYVYDKEEKKVTLYDKLNEEGLPVVINFWATWCPPCKAELPDFDEVYKEYAGRAEFMMVNLTDGQRDTKNAVDQFVLEGGYSFPVYYDKDMNAAAVYGVNSIPATVLVSTDGEVLYYHTGIMTGEQLRSIIDKALEG